jgi:2-dehydropantoate 2-reductase
MKVLIIGAGAIGSIYGWALSNAGHKIVHFVRPGRASQFTDGLQIDMMDKRKGHKKYFNGIYKIKATEVIDTTDSYDIVIVPVKHYSLEQTLKQIVPLTPNAGYVLLTHNWKGTSEIDKIIEKDAYIYGDVQAGGSFQSKKLIATIYAIHLGSIENKQNKCLKKAELLFKSADIKTTLQDNILHYIWIQYAINGGGWPALVKAGSLRGILQDRDLVKKTLFAIKECLSVVAARGVDLTLYKNVTGIYINDSIMKHLLGMFGMYIVFRFSEYVRRNSAHSLSDPKEIKTFYYDLLNTGDELGVNMPVMDSFKADMEKLATSIDSLKCSE